MTRKEGRVVSHQDAVRALARIVRAATRAADVSGCSDCHCSEADGGAAEALLAQEDTLKHVVVGADVTAAGEEGDGCAEDASG